MKIREGLIVPQKTDMVETTQAGVGSTSRLHRNSSSNHILLTNLEIATTTTQQIHIRIQKLMLCFIKKPIEKVAIGTIQYQPKIRAVNHVSDVTSTYAHA